MLNKTKNIVKLLPISVFLFFANKVFAKDLPMVLYGPSSIQPMYGVNVPPTPVPSPIDNIIEPSPIINNIQYPVVIDNASMFVQKNLMFIYLSLILILAFGAGLVVYFSQKNKSNKK
jgi:hypothetical protein